MKTIGHDMYSFNSFSKRSARANPIGSRIEKGQRLCQVGKLTVLQNDVERNAKYAGAGIHLHREGESEQRFYVTPPPTTACATRSKFDEKFDSVIRRRCCCCCCYCRRVDDVFSPARAATFRTQGTTLLTSWTRRECLRGNNNASNFFGQFFAVTLLHFVLFCGCMFTFFFVKFKFSNFFSVFYWCVFYSADVICW